MGTRADFYIGRITSKSKKMEWIGSITYDGYPDGVPSKVLKAKTKEQYIKLVDKLFKNEGPDYVTRPSEGWPWPWDKSDTTDYAYAFDEGKVWVSCFGSDWYIHNKKDDIPEGNGAKFPNMAKKRNKDIIMPKSGLLIIEGSYENGEVTMKQTTNKGNKNGRKKIKRLA